MAEIEKEAVGIPMICHLWQKNLHKVATSYFFYLFSLFSCIKQIVNLANMLGCKTTALPCTKQIVLWY